MGILRGREWREAHAPELLDSALTAAQLDEIWTRLPKAALAELKRVLAGPVYELFDLRDDPGELVDLAAARPGLMASLKLVLLENKKLARSEAVDSSAESAPEFSESELERLRSLGYLD